MRPIDFEDAQETLAQEFVISEIQRVINEHEARKRFEMIKARKRWERHWRTRLSKWLRSVAHHVALPEPPEC